jgi:hypothetical protein
MTSALPHRGRRPVAPSVGLEVEIRQPEVWMPRRSLAALLVLLVASPAVSHGLELSDSVVAAFRGKIVLSRAAVAPGANDKETIAKLKAAQLPEVTGKASDEGQAWRFHYTIFLKKAGNDSLHLRFISGEKDGRFAAETSIPIPDVEAPVLSGDLTVNESQGLSRGKAYILQLANDKGEVLAKTSATFK